MSSSSDKGINFEAFEDRQSEKAQLKEAFLNRGRALQAWEILALEERGNRAEDWSKIRVEEKFRPEAYHNNRFYEANFLSLQEGKVTIQGDELDCLVENCTFKQCHLEAGLSLKQVQWMERVYVKGLAKIWGVSRFVHGEEHWKEVLEISVGSEVQGRVLRLTPEMDPMQLEKLLGQPKLDQGLESMELPFSVVCHQVQIEGVSKIQSVYLSEGTSVIGAQEVLRVVSLSNVEEPVFIGVGVSARDAFLQWGCRLDRSAQVEKVFMLEQSSVDLHGIVVESCIGSNTHVAKGEITASFVGPFVGMHHQSLLIGTLWPEGRGNIGYGANVGSNHTGRAPDQEFWAGEGEFFGLSSSVKFPGYHRNAPFSILATGVVMPPSKMEFPFSLVMPSQHKSEKIEGDLELIPAWLLVHNRYSLVRSSWKIKNRNKSKRYPFDGNYLNSKSMASSLKALEFLESLPEKTCYGKEEMPLLPGVFMRRERVLEAIQAYREAIELYLATNSLPETEKQTYLDKLQGSQIDEIRLRELKQKEYDLAVASVEKDRKRGQQITPDYDDYHPGIESDPCLLELQQALVIK